jgi:hypothetical protein
MNALTLWGRVGVGAHARTSAAAPIPAFPQRGKEKNL